MTKLYDGQDGSKWVETGEYTVEGAECEQGTVYLHSGKVLRVDRDGNSKWAGACPILRLATPEEIAGMEKPVVHLTPESVGKAYRNGFTKVTVEEACESGVYQVRGAYNQLGQAYWVKEDGKLADRCEAWTATFHNVKDKDLDLISEWDEKAEAGGLRVDAATIAGRTITLPVDASGLVPVAFIAPAQPEILPTWADSDVLAEAVKIWGPTDVWRKDDVMHWRKMLVAWLNAPDDAPEDDDEPAKPDAPDRRAEHVPVAKAWVNPAMLGR